MPRPVSSMSPLPLVVFPALPVQAPSLAGLPDQTTRQSASAILEEMSPYQRPEPFVAVGAQRSRKGSEVGATADRANQLPATPETISRLASIF